MISTEVWLQVEPTFSAYASSNGDRSVTKIRVANVTSRRPTGRAKAGTMVMRLKLNVPEAAFKPLAPVVTIEVPSDMLLNADDVNVVVESPEE
jgi:hypothetical protein